MTEPGSKPKKVKKPRGPALNIFLFLAAFASTWLAGGLFYMGSIMAILLSHEMGHYLMARRNRVDASLPYFLPLPPPFILGTGGAVILMRGRIRSRSALMEIGAAGPLAGMVVAIPLMIIGLYHSPIGPIPETGLMEGQSLLYIALKRLVFGEIPEGMDVMLHPMAWAGWVGTLVTMLNLLPIGQLDGGHVAYALWGQHHAKISKFFFFGLFFFGLAIATHGYRVATNIGLEGDAFWAWVAPGFSWCFFGLMLLAFGRGTKRILRHPPTDDDRLSPRHKIVGYVCVAIFFLTFIPVPLRILGL